MNDAANPTDAGPAEYDEYNMPDGVDAKAVTAAADAGGAAIDLDDQIDEEELLVTPGMNWFVLRVASNKESSVRATLLKKIKIEGYDGEHETKPHLVNRILVPTEKTKTMKAGKQKIVETKLYPGYVFVEMQLEDDGRIPQDVFFPRDRKDAHGLQARGRTAAGQDGVPEGRPHPYHQRRFREHGRHRGRAHARPRQGQSHRHDLWPGHADREYWIIEKFEE